MLIRFSQALRAAITTFRSQWLLAEAAPRAAFRPVWDDGINYDIPTFLRRRAG